MISKINFVFEIKGNFLETELLTYAWGESSCNITTGRSNQTSTWKPHCFARFYKEILIVCVYIFHMMIRSYFYSLFKQYFSSRNSFFRSTWAMRKITSKIKQYEGEVYFHLHTSNLGHHETETRDPTYILVNPIGTRTINISL